MASRCVLILGLVAALRTGDACGANLQSLPMPTRPGSAEPRFAPGPDGTLALSWLEPRTGSGHRLRWSHWTGRQWTKPTTIAEGDSFFVNWADFPSIRWLEGRRWVAHWLWRNGGDTYAYEVRLSFSEDGGKTWGKPVVPHRDGTQTEHGFVTLLSEAGSARVVWLDGRNFEGRDEHSGPGPEMTVRTALVASDGEIRQEAELDDRACDCCATAAVSTGSGMVVAYRDRSADEIRDISVVRLREGGWSRPASVHADGWMIAGCPVNGPALDAAGQDVGITWYTAASESARVLTTWSSDGGQTFAPPVRVDEGAPLGRVGMALMTDKSAFVTWLEGGAKDTRVLGRRVTPTGERGKVLTVARTSAARASGFPQVARVGTDLFFAWTETGQVSRIRGARLRLGQERGSK
jgi:hypothetical protein